MHFADPISTMKRIFLPLAWIYNLITRFRNHLYNIGYRRSVKFDGVFLIGVGNLNMGGTGKTPVTEYLVELLQKEFRLATLSRGYGRKSQGFRLLNGKDNHLTAGDEPVQLFRKFGDRVGVVVAEERALAIPTLLLERPDTEIVILDDAFQHRRIQPDLNILLTRFDQPFHRDSIFPVGWLREARVGARRADVVLFTKVPERLSASEREMHSTAARKYAGDVPVYFCNHAYGKPIAFGNHPEITTDVVLVTGIAQSAFLANALPDGLRLVKHFRYPDHHAFLTDEIDTVVRFARQAGVSILTTEKDMVRLTALSINSLITDNPWFYLPVRVVFQHGGPEFDNLVLQKIREKFADPNKDTDEA